MRSLTDLDPAEERVLGALMEKQQTTPDYYPLTVKALVSACNQKTNRAPVMELGEMDVLNTLRVLQQDGWVERISGARVQRWGHLAESRLGANRSRLALLTLLLLRGAQTGGEFRSRSERMFPFDSVDAVLERLRGLSDQDPPLVERLPRQSGQKESRWILFGHTPAQVPTSSVLVSARPSSTAADFQSQLDELKRRVEQLESELGIEAE